MVIFMNEIARNNPNDKLSDKSLNNCEQSHMAKLRNKSKKRKEKK